MQVVLVMFRNDGERRSFSVVRNMTIIGRREDCDLRIPVGEVSRKHCRLVMTDDGIRIEDLGSSNGTWVNGNRVQESDLSPGDTVTVGPVQFVVQINGVPSDHELTAPAPASGPAIDDEDSLMGFESPAAPPNVVDSGEFSIEQPIVESEETPAEEFQIEEESAAVTESLDEKSSPDEAPAPTGELAIDDDFTFEDEPATAPAAIDEFALEDKEPALEKPERAAEPKPVIEDELGLPEFPATPAVADDEFVIPDLDAASDATAPAPAKSAGDSEWDFAIEESSDEEATPDFDLDLDSPHQQPHK